MRLPLVTPLESRDGTSNTDGRMTNVLSEDGGSFAAVRPGLSTQATSSGNGNGMAEFSNTFISIYGTAVKRGPTLIAVTGAVTNAMFDFVESTT